MTFQIEKLNATVKTRMTSGHLEPKTSIESLSRWEGMHISLEGQGALDQIIVNVTLTSPIEEIFTPAPNFEDIQYAHPLQTVSLGYTTNHPDFRFGAQWMFTPPPLVFPVRMGSGWEGIAVAARPGRNLFSTITYRPVDRFHFQITISYDGYYSDPGEACTILFSREEYRNPEEVIKGYADQLRELQWVPSPQRKHADWWYEPLVCTWGEQFNIHQQAKANPRKEHQQLEITSYETQANQTRWLRRLLDKQIPFGVVSTSDKWQVDRYRLIPDEARYEDFRGFADWHHREGRHAIAWWGLWSYDGAPLEWCIRDSEGRPVAVDPENQAYRKVLEEDIERLLSPSGYDYDGFFLDFTGKQPIMKNMQKSGSKWGIELLHDYVKLIYDTAKSVKPDAMIMTHCPHPYFADVTDVLRLNDWSYRNPNLVEQARYRTSIARACSDWLINTDNWFMYDLDQWRELMAVQPELGIPATWYTHGIYGSGIKGYRPFTDEDYENWRANWTQYMDRIQRNNHVR